ncbi:CPBP family intramembrane glutamic endopeptidase [Lapidilactobacillus bayanensis]|uniref:CPBP family intramembrane glutamic endopeptidase n=1 Tax=Lapidilactobacillus bayanensis TaxID=2485998 RepID=UPI000F76D814|nr:type II CAAX endopeptidase family protein [Lapidilactobacillus bayanensis]
MNNKNALSKIIYMLITYLIIMFLPSLVIQLFGLKGVTAINWQVGITFVGVIAMLWVDHTSDIKANLEPDKKLSLADTSLYGLGGMLLMYATEIAASLIIILLFGQPTASQNTQMILTIVRRAPLFIVYGVVLAPIMEELVFRKTIYGVGRQLINPTGAMVISALLFGLAHNDNQYLLVYSSLGLMLCWLYKRTGSIRINMIAHGLFNGITMALALLAFK